MLGMAAPPNLEYFETVSNIRDGLEKVLKKRAPPPDSGMAICKPEFKVASELEDEVMTINHNCVATTGNHATVTKQIWPPFLAQEPWPPPGREI